MAKPGIKESGKAFEEVGMDGFLNSLDCAELLALILKGL